MHLRTYYKQSDEETDFILGPVKIDCHCLACHQKQKLTEIIDQVEKY